MPKVGDRIAVGAWNAYVLAACDELTLALTDEGELLLDLHAGDEAVHSFGGFDVPLPPQEDSAKREGFDWETWGADVRKAISDVGFLP